MSPPPQEYSNRLNTVVVFVPKDARNPQSTVFLAFEPSTLPVVAVGPDPDRSMPLFVYEFWVRESYDILKAGATVYCEMEVTGTVGSVIKHLDRFRLDGLHSYTVFIDDLQRGGIISPDVARRLFSTLRDLKVT